MRSVRIGCGAHAGELCYSGRERINNEFADGPWGEGTRGKVLVPLEVAKDHVVAHLGCRGLNRVLFVNRRVVIGVCLVRRAGDGVDEKQPSAAV